jgi:SAM-dependent methyltransferase
MTHFEEILGDISGGRALDVSAAEGSLLTELHRNLRDHSIIIGVNRNRSSFGLADRDMQNGQIQFVQSNAYLLAFEDECFDTVSIAYSLHYLENVPRVLAEMKRTLKIGGRFIITEMHRDGTTTAQFNAIRIHHWAAEVDSALGNLHDRTFSRSEILSYPADLNLYDLTTWDISNIDSDPRDNGEFKSANNLIDRYLQRARQIPAGEILVQRGVELRNSVQEIGIQKEPLVVAIGEKR